MFQIIIDTIANPVIITDGRNLLKSNKEFINFFNYKDIEDFTKHNGCVCHLFLKDDDYFSLAKIDESVLWTDYIYNHDKDHKVLILDKDGEPRTFHITLNPLEEGRSYYIVVFTDITAAQNEKKLLEIMAYNDPLTNIYNRQMFNKLMIKELENKKRHGDNLSLIMLDIDHFKKLNDTYGHNIGDKVLITLTQLISKNLRTNDVFARWGGEEFMILLPRTDAGVAYDKAKELKKLIDDYKNKIPHFTVSFGVTEVLNSDKEQSVFIRVDKALYQAKIKRNDVVLL